MSDFNFLNNTSNSIPDASFMRFGIITTEWNSHITEEMLNNAIKTLLQHGVAETNITVRRVPGSFELIYGCSQFAQHGYIDAIIAIGCVIKGDTPHFDYICEGTTQGLVKLNATGKIPIINGVLTVNTEAQALERSGTKMNKGKEFAITAIKMVDFMKSFE